MSKNLLKWLHRIFFLGFLLRWANTSPFNYCQKISESHPSAFSGTGIGAIIAVIFRRFVPLSDIPVTQFSAVVGYAS